MEVEDRSNEEMLETARRAVSSALATVPGLNPDTEDSLIGEQQWQAIHERRAAGQGVSKIARELELDRKTVRSSLRQSCPLPVRQAAGDLRLRLPALDRQEAGAAA